MQCSRCHDTAVLFQPYSGRHLCKRHLVRDIESRAKRSVRSHGGIRPGDRIGVLLRGDRSSAALLLFMKNLVAGRRDIRLFAIPAPGPGDHDAALRIAESLVPECREMDETTATRIAIPVCLDDVAQDVIQRFLAGDADRVVSPPPAVWNGRPVITPFLTIPANEISLYWDLEGTLSLPGTGQDPGRDPLSEESRRLLQDFSRRHPATRHAILRLAEDLSSGSAHAVAMDAWRCSLRDGDA